MIRNLPNAAGYSDSKGIVRGAQGGVHYTQQQSMSRA